MKNYKTDQEKFWAGKFGDEYAIRNNEREVIINNTSLFSKILSRTTSIDSIIEFGANIGQNLIALQALLPDINVSAIEINKNAIEKLSSIEGITIYEDSILDYKTDFSFDFVLIKGVLIHINPDELHDVYKKLYDSSDKYICIVEYYNPTPIAIDYRGHNEKLFKRDFAGEMLDKYKSLELIDYGFVYHRDNHFPLDDLTWFLLKKPENDK